MQTYPVPKFGSDPADLVDSASYHTDLLEMLAAYKRGDFTADQTPLERDLSLIHI